MLVKKTKKLVRCTRVTSLETFCCHNRVGIGMSEARTSAAVKRPSARSVLAEDDFTSSAMAGETSLTTQITSNRSLKLSMKNSACCWEGTIIS